MSLTAMQTIIGEINTQKGFRALPTTPGDRLALIHSEISEALEEVRKGHALDFIYYEDDAHGVPKPEGYPVELADALIRIVDEFDRLGISAEKTVELKMAYNETRPFLHGGKAL